MTDKPKNFVPAILTAKASKELQEEILKELLVEDTEKTDAHLKEILSDDSNRPTIQGK